MNKKQLAKYNEYLRKTDSKYNSLENILKVKKVDAPSAITLQTLIIYSILAFIISGFIFLYAGLVPNADSYLIIKIMHPISYMFMIVSSVFILASLATQLNDRESWRTTRRERINKAINLAKEHDGFDNFPPIKFQTSKEVFTDGSYLIVEVLVGPDPYTIVTDNNAEILYSVNKSSSSSASASKPVN